MNVDRKSMELYAITDRTWLNGRELSHDVEEALKGGITFLQLREKDLGYEEFLKEAVEIKKLTDKYNIPFVINDNVEVAIKCNADGVHVGQSDMAARDIRKLLGEDKIIGVSAGTVEEALEAERSGADYIGVGAVFSTSTKKDAGSVSFDVLKEICDKVSIPVVAIGGISSYNISRLKGTGIDGISVISAIFAQKDILSATKELLSLTKEIIRK